jgi:hypothetical protein
MRCSKHYLAETKILTNWVYTCLEGQHVKSERSNMYGAGRLVGEARNKKTKGIRENDLKSNGRNEMSPGRSQPIDGGMVADMRC